MLFIQGRACTCTNFVTLTKIIIAGGRGYNSVLVMSIDVTKHNNVFIYSTGKTVNILEN